MRKSDCIEGSNFISFNQNLDLTYGTGLNNHPGKIFHKFCRLSKIPIYRLLITGRRKIALARKIQ